MARVRLLCAVGVLAVAACSSDPREDESDAGSTKQDGGIGTHGPYPFPVARMDDGKLGFTHDSMLEGVVAKHSSAQAVPSSFGEVRPARVLSVRATSGSTDELYYTLPTPFSFNAAMNDQVKVHYREKVESFGSSYGAKVEGYFGGLRVLFEDGRFGPAFDQADRLNFTFERDLQPLNEESDDCGRKVRYPAIVGQGEDRKRLFPGDAADFTLTTGGDVTFTLLDLYRIEDSVCGNAAEYSIAYIVLPKG